MLRRIIHGRFWCLLMTIGVASIPPEAEGSNTCVYISNHQSIESQAHQKLHAMNLTQCTTTSNSYLRKAACTSKTKDGGSKNVFVKLECFCALKTNDQSIQCEPSKVALCCSIDNVVCLNGGKLNNEISNCSAKPKPIYKCECPKVLDGGGNYMYRGERCENISVIRKCVYKDSDTVNASLNSCDEENDVNRTCIHSVIDTAYECGPASRNFTGKSVKKCERRYNSTKAHNKGDQEDVSVTPECNSGEKTAYQIAIVVESVFVVAFIIIWCMCYRRSGNKKLFSPQRSLQVHYFQDGEDGVDDQIDEDSETDVEEATPERRPFLMRSKSAP